LESNGIWLDRTMSAPPLQERIARPTVTGFVPSGVYVSSETPVSVLGKGEVVIMDARRRATARDGS